MRTLATTLSLLLLAACSAEAPAPVADTAPVAAGEQATPAPTGGPVELTSMLDDWWEANLRNNPVFATAIGDLRYNDQLRDSQTAEARAEALALEHEYLARARTIDPGKLQGQDRLSWEIFVRDREEAIASARFPEWMLPVGQFGNLGSGMARMGSGQGLQPFTDVKQYEDFLSRIAAFPALNDTAIANMREGMRAGIVQPRPIVEKVIPQYEVHIVSDPEQSVFWGPIANMPDTIPAADRERLAAAYRAAITGTLLPAYTKMRDFLKDEYLPAARDTVGLSALPDGQAWYAFKVREQTTTGLTTEQIHEFGKQEVARILDEMNKVREQVGFEGDLPAFFAHLQADDRFYFRSEEDALQAYRDIQAKIGAALPQLFDIFPKADYEVRPVEAFRAASEAGASYQPPAPDGSRPGIFYLNTHNLRAQPNFLVETLSIHEASPGHHFQISIAQEVEELPAFRRFGGYTAYSEGWALYAESLGKEMGLFTDPYQWYGRLSDEQLRAMRLVVDTGLHHYGWTRQQAIDYMKANSSMAESDIVAEVERYIVIPGQALAYKVGQREIRTLREEAERELGDRFNVRAFHRQVLVDGALPMDVLATKIRAWIAAQKAAPAAA